MLSIEQIPPRVTWRLRRDVLYPGLHYNDMMMEEDEQGYHFGAFENDRLVGVVSLFQNGNDWQFRKLAVITEGQGKGIGTQMIAYITAFAKREQSNRLWCNARLSATGFYEKLGFAKTDHYFTKKDIDYVIMEKSLPAE